LGQEINSEIFAQPVNKWAKNSIVRLLLKHGASPTAPAMTVEAGRNRAGFLLAAKAPKQFPSM